MSNPYRLLKNLSGIFAAASLVALAGCGGGSSGDPDNRGAFTLTELTTGLNQIFPYRVRKVDPFTGNPTNEIVDITDEATMKDNVSGNNGLLPVGVFGTAATLPDGQPGNQFLLFVFSHKLNVTTILSDKLADVTNSGLTTAISVLEYDANTESSITVKGRGFVGGFTYVNDGSGNLVLTKAVEADANGDVQVLHPIAAGFPRGFTNDERLVGPKAFVFVADSDDNLATLETFPDAAVDNKVLRVIVTNAVGDTGDKVLEQEACTATTVGTDPQPADVLGFSGNKKLDITPGNNQQNVDPRATLLVRFNKPVQPADMGQFFEQANLTPSSGGVTLNVTIAATTFAVIYHADPLTVGDFCNYMVTPAYNMPGDSTVNVSVNNSTVRDLKNAFIGNTVNTNFDTGKGPGIVNAPIGADALYVGMGGSKPGLKIVDLNGFGQGTGGYIIDPSGNVEPTLPPGGGFNTNFPNNPNLGSTGITPNLAPGTTTLDAGGAGVFTLVQDTAGNTLLLGDPLLGRPADIQIGCPLDMVFNNFNINVNASTANHSGRGNNFSEVPHPNPPRLVFPPPNPGQVIFAEEGTAAPVCVLQPIDHLVSGNPFATNGQPGLFGHAADSFNGPAPAPASPPPPTPSCPFSIRQQIGHFLYILDGGTKNILVVNSNRMTVLDSIRLPDPVDMAVSPNCRTLAVSNSASGTISFINIDPTSLEFHKVVGETRVGPGPTSVIYQSEGEDILAIHPNQNKLSVIKAIDLQLRKSVTGFLNDPLDLVCTPRFQFPGGAATGLYYAYILNRNGTVAIFESGPDGVNGIGFDNIIGTVPNQVFRNPRKMAPLTASLMGGCFISHLDALGNGQVTKLELMTSPGVQPIQQMQGGFILPPTFRQQEWHAAQTFGGIDPSNPTKDLLSGRAPHEIMTDEMLNFAILPGQGTQFNSGIPGPPMTHSGKNQVKVVPGGVIPVGAPKFIFIALVDRGLIDVFDAGTAQKVYTIDVGGTPSVLGGYFRQ
ncbi:MAG: YncE family protein [Planctomycetota bacterium]|jgi:hypothetical protein